MNFKYFQFQDIEELFNQFKSHNESKNIFKAARTPAVFFAIAVFFYIVSGVLGLLGMYDIANLCNMVMGVALLTLIVWSYVRYDIYSLCQLKFFCWTLINIITVFRSVPAIILSENQKILTYQFLMVYPIQSL